jgi:hypothetical protein
MVLIDTGDYWLARFLLRRGLAAIYLVAFLVAAHQFRPLSGEDGILPLGPFLDRTTWRDHPSLFRYLDSDRALGLGSWLGVGLALVALLGLPARLGTISTVVVWAALWALYLSFVNVGQLFYGYGWESMLLEAGFLAMFLGGAGVATPDVVIWLFRWLLFRNMLGAGLIKLRGDECWRDLTCLDYHYETQPMPNPLSWFVHHAHPIVHRIGVVVNHVAEVGVPFLYFVPGPVAAAAGIVTILFQGWLILTGNFAWLNWLTVVLAFATVPDRVAIGLATAVVDRVAGTAAAALPTPTIPDPAATPLPLELAAIALLLLVLALSVGPARNLISPGQRMNASFDPLHLVNTYGAFGSITKTRYELVIQGTDADEVGSDTEWRTYEIPGKPTDPGTRPPQIAPYHHRLGWQLWFAAMAPSPRSARHRWVHRFLAKLLQGDDGVRSLLAHDPFPDGPPTHVRILRYRYRFTTPAERRERGEWWDRERVGIYVEPVRLEGGRLRPVRHPGSGVW